MRKLRAFFIRLRGLFSKQDRLADVTAEIESLLELEIEANVASGMTPEEARRSALHKIGGIQSLTEKCGDQISLLPASSAGWRLPCRVLVRL